MTDFIQQAVIDALRQTELLGKLTAKEIKNASLVIKSTIKSVGEGHEDAYTEELANVMISALEGNLLYLGLSKVDPYIKNLRDEVASAAERDAQYRRDYAEDPKFYAEGDAIAARRHSTEKYNRWSESRFLKHIAKGSTVEEPDVPHVYDPSKVATQPAIDQPSAKSRGHSVHFAADVKPKKGSRPH